MKSAVQFGAGNIGRGFIGLLLHQAGYAVTFVDVSAALVDAINRQGRYGVRFAGSAQPPATVDRISAVLAADEPAVARAVADADLVTTAVGPRVLPSLAPAIARGLAARPAGRAPAVVIACENLIGASAVLHAAVKPLLPAEKENAAVFPNCAVDRIVPVQSVDPADPLAVTVEPYAEWVIESTAFGRQLPPELPGVRYVDSLAPYIERKLFTVNTGHAALAYLGHRAGLRFIHEVSARPEILATAEAALRESGAGLQARHALSGPSHEHYIRSTLARFANPVLADELTRVARSPLRKLGPDERLIAPARLAAAAGIEPRAFARVIAAALRYDFAGDPEAVALQAALRAEGPAATLTRLTGLAASDPLHRAVLTHYHAS
jgi:mannitol-1-phosphate 5-dehydrogenase